MIHDPLAGDEEETPHVPLARRKRQVAEEIDGMAITAVVIRIFLAAALAAHARVRRSR
jgi:hypothetical protein